MTRDPRERSAERRRLRQLRASLPEDERRRADRAISRRVIAAGFVRPHQRTAVYLASLPGEVNLDYAIRRGWQIGAELFAPRIASLRRRTMTFVALESFAPLERSSYGLLEPRSHRRIRHIGAGIDVVLVPMLGFDRAGHRLGMGGGFYDRMLRRRLDPQRSWRRPRLVGIAYACQELEHVEPAPWDVALDYVVTEKELINCRLHAGRGTNA
jgi:5-formyltetrahydrofolate cyclo-ligase